MALKSYTYDKNCWCKTLVKRLMKKINDNVLCSNFFFACEKSNVAIFVLKSVFVFFLCTHNRNKNVIIRFKGIHVTLLRNLLGLSTTIFYRKYYPFVHCSKFHFWFFHMLINFLKKKKMGVIIKKFRNFFTVTAIVRALLF